MKKLLPLLLLPFIFVSAHFGESYRPKPANAFGAGEKITYRVHYGFITAGEAQLIIDKKIHHINSRPTYHIDVNGRTTGLADKVYNVNNNWGTYIDTASIVPHRSYRYIREGNYRKNEVISFQQLNKKAVVNLYSRNGKELESSTTYDIPLNVQDMVSGYYYLRTLDYKNAKAGDVLSVEAFFDKEVYNFKVRFLGREKIKTDIGKHDALVMAPILPENSIFTGEDAIKLWLSDDQYKIPLKIKANMFIGAIEVDVRRFEKGR